MAKCSKSYKRFDSINVIPFIDIMLVLLVMVLTTTTFIKHGIIPVDLPKSKASSSKNVEKEISILVDAKGDIYYDKEKVSIKILEKKLSSISSNQTVVLRSDKESKFQDFVSIMSILKKLHHKQLYIVTKE